ncbi:hypothetical protein AXO1947_00520 [Xanthomonas oryzae pv. oryzae]|nr:hypothetical protein AXO1947_00520 [Xanthomonas oryzae pv. oryzae]
MIPQMIKRGYDRDYAVNVSMTAALVALLVPPSHNLILFSAAAGGGLSIADLFAAGIFPALLTTAAMMFTGYAVARHRGYGTEPFPGWRAVTLRLIGAPIGSVLFIGTSIAQITIAQSMRTIWPFWLAALCVLLIVAFFPELSLWLPRALRA